MAQLQKGDPAPDFDVMDDQNNVVRLGDLLGKRVVLYFYPRDNTPGCTTQACGFRDSYPAIAGKNAMVFGVSTDSAASHQKFRSKFDLPFPLLVDADHKLADAYGVWQQKTMAGRKYMGMVRSHFVIDEQGRILDAQYSVKPVDSPIKALSALG